MFSRIRTVNLGLTPNLTSSHRYQIKDEWLTDGTHDDEILAAHIDHTTRCLAAIYGDTLRRMYNQSAEVNNILDRYPKYDIYRNVSLRYPGGPLNATQTPPVIGTMTDWTNQRVVQSKESTAVLVVLLSALLVLHSVAGIQILGEMCEDKGVLREDPGTIAAMARLLKGSISLSILRRTCWRLACTLCLKSTDIDAHTTATKSFLPLG